MAVVLPVMLALICVSWGGAAAAAANELRSCLQAGGVTNFTVPESGASYASTLQFSIQNLRYNETWVPKPDAIVQPGNVAQVQATVRCCVRYGWHIKVRGGGHSYEAQSSWSDVSFVVLDLANLAHVAIDVASESAWVQTGTTLGNLYTAIANASGVHGFPGGTCPTVCIGGLASGGGYGMLTRKYGLAADNILDALVVGPTGDLLNRTSMGNDVFWALRGGGGGSWGVVVAWKLRLVRVPRNVTVFTLNRGGRANVARLMHKWQFVGAYTVDDLQLRVEIMLNSTAKDTYALFYGYYLGNASALLHIMDSSFPELNLTPADCKELSYIDAANYFAQEYLGTSLTSRYFTRKAYFKAKSDFARKPLSVAAWEGLCALLEQRAGAQVLINSFGGAMERIPPDASPFPQRRGTLMIIHYGYFWTQTQTPANESMSLQYVRHLADYLQPYVTGNPRGAYVNYLDLDLGYAYNGTATVQQAAAWGVKYFGSANYARMVRAKTQFDPTNVFRYAQSIPPCTSAAACAFGASPELLLADS